MKAIWRYLLSMTMIVLGLLGILAFYNDKFMGDEWYVLLIAAIVAQLVIIPAGEFWTKYFKNLIP